MTFAKDVGIAFLIFALAGALHAGGMVSSSVKYVIHNSIWIALIAYAIALSMRGGFRPRPLKIRMYAFGSALLVLASSVALGSEGIAQFCAFIIAVYLAYKALPLNDVT
jgi:hypothetical protein